VGASWLAISFKSPASWLLRSGLHELQRHAIAFADRQVFLAILAAFLERRRQSPDTAGIVFRVVRIGVDLALADQLEARAFRQVDHVVLGQIAAALHLFGRR